MESSTFTWSLPVSKTDPSAVGCTRSWGCLCQTSSAAACPFHAAVRQLELLRSTFGSRVDDADFPLFPTSSGDYASGEAMVALVEYLAVALGEELTSASGGRRFGKHSWRAFGSVYLSSLQLKLFKIQLLARWSSIIILHPSLRALGSPRGHDRTCGVTSIRKLVGEDHARLPGFADLRESQSSRVR